MMKLNFQKTLLERKEAVDASVLEYLSNIQLQNFEGLTDLRKSFEYSLVRGGKRFRPVLSLLLAEEFGVSPKRILPFAMAVEMIHTYSLIHDDLPCMDNDDIRRGEPTNHKVFGESTALLAGDALLTEAFFLLSTAYEDQPAIAVKLIRLLSEAAGILGMVGGQAIDMKAKGLLPNQTELEHMHAMKTGALIRVSCEGAAVASSLLPEKIQNAKEFGAHLGFAFQLADDLLDSVEGQIEKGSFPDLIGLEKTKSLLMHTSEKAIQSLQNMGIQSGNLHQLVEYNSLREK